ncbi:MAG: hypothetical protein AAF357_07075, partial [Verrucomicrobiota bacterium]
RRQFEEQIHEVFVGLHGQLVNVVRESKRTGETGLVDKLKEVELAMQPLSNDIDKFNYSMLKAIESGRVGRDRPMPTSEP